MCDPIIRAVRYWDYHNFIRAAICIIRDLCILSLLLFCLHFCSRLAYSRGLGEAWRGEKLRARHENGLRSATVVSDKPDIGFFTATVAAAAGSGVQHRVSARIHFWRERVPSSRGTLHVYAKPLQQQPRDYSYLFRPITCVLYCAREYGISLSGNSRAGMDG